MTAGAEAWIDLLLKRGPELRAAGVLSIGIDGMSAVLAPPGPAAADEKDDKKTEDVAAEPSDAWEKPESYPNGHVPTLEVERELPEIPQFDND